MSEDIKLSVIMPCYNVEKYLTKCIESVLSSTLKDIEIILVDDGSPDKCPEIIDEYAKKDSRVIAVHKTNGGYGSAVNVGIDKARGKYIGIVETDDWISPDMYEKLYNKAIETGADCIKGNFYSYFSKDTIIPHIFDSRLPISKTFKLKDNPELLLLAPSIWSAIYKKEFLIEKKIKLVENIKPYEDLPFAFETYAKADKIVLINDYVYFYRCEPNQGSSTIRKDKKLFNIIQQFKTTIKKQQDIGSWNYTKSVIYKHMYNCMFLFVGNVNFWLKRSLYKEFSKLCVIFKCENASYEYFTKSEIKKIKRLERNNFFRFWLSCIQKKIKNHLKTKK